MPKHVRKGDQVIVTSGDHKGSTGEVLEVITKTDRVIVKGVNLRTKHVKPTQVNPQGGIISKEMSIHISNVSPVVDGRATRVRFPTRVAYKPFTVDGICSAFCASVRPTRIVNQKVLPLPASLSAPICPPIR